MASGTMERCRGADRIAGAGRATTAIKRRGHWITRPMNCAFVIEKFGPTARRAPTTRRPANATSYTTVPGFNLQPGPPTASASTRTRLRSIGRWRACAGDDPVSAAGLRRRRHGRCLGQPPARAYGPLIPDAGGHSQLDSDGDGDGNACDADLNNSGLVTVGVGLHHPAQRAQHRQCERRPQRKRAGDLNRLHHFA